MTKTLLFPIILLLTFTFCSNPDTGKCITGNCDSGVGKMLYSDGTVYEGEFVNSRIEGKGRFKNPQGDFYEGNWKDGKKHGYGKFIYASGDSYEGYFENGVKHGKGEFKYSDGTLIYGNFANGDPEGLCVVEFTNGTKLTGFYRKGIIFNGSGIYIYDNGSRYIGEWKSGKREGKGILLDETGKTIKTGTWKEDEFTGE